MTSKPDHLERTAAEPRDKSLNTVVLRHIEEVNDTARIFRLEIPRGSPPIRSSTIAFTNRVKSAGWNNVVLGFGDVPISPIDSSSLSSPAVSAAMFLPGQWLDVYVPGVERAGGFTITSTPRDARLPHPPLPPSSSTTHESSPAAATFSSSSSHDGSSAATTTPGGGGGPYLELAVQRSPESPSAAWLWRSPADAILGSELRVRVGGGFVFPPPGVNVRALRRVVFVAGGMGVNPLVSMLGSLLSPASASTPPGFEVHFLYSLRDNNPGDERRRRRRRRARDMLFVERIARLFREGKVKGRFQVFLTAGTDKEEKEEEEEEGVERRGQGEDGEIICGEEDGYGGDGKGDLYTVPFHPRRCTVDGDVAEAVGAPAERRLAVVYVCGVPTMTDEFVARLTDREHGLGMDPHRVLCEKWW
ncbi:hypothetical protein F4782DRAFT_532785 [Xylaria castorea]|nr:hypothetical protein F4782DRAFT_532785 [Xylaria castorea]